MPSSALSLGERLLAEIHEESLDEVDILCCHIRSMPIELTCFQVLRDIRTENHSGCVTHVKEIDDLLDVFLGRTRAGDLPEQHTPAAQETGHSRRRQRLPVVEITSPSSGDGKTQLIYLIAAVSVLPASFKGVAVGGRDSAVVILDLDGRFDVDRLFDVAKGFVERILRPGQAAEETAQPGLEDQRSVISDSSVASLITAALQHVHIYRPQSSSALLATLRQLDAYLFNTTKHSSATRRLGAILLDSMSAFYYQDRLRDELARTEEIGMSAGDIARARDGKTSFHLSVLYREICDELRRLQNVFDCAVLYTTWGINRVSGTAAPSFRPHLPPPWPTFPCVRIVVSRDSVRPFAPNASIMGMERDAPIRQSVVQQGKFSAWVDHWGAENWAPSVIAALNRMDGRGGFAFWVRDDGVFRDV